jgi:hypothetical protein
MRVMLGIVMALTLVVGNLGCCCCLHDTCDCCQDICSGCHTYGGYYMGPVKGAPKAEEIQKLPAPKDGPGGAPGKVGEE